MPRSKRFPVSPLILISAIVIVIGAVAWWSFRQSQHMPLRPQKMIETGNPKAGVHTLLENDDEMSW